MNKNKIVQFKKIILMLKTLINATLNYIIRKIIRIKIIKYSNVMDIYLILNFYIIYKLIKIDEIAKVWVRSEITHHLIPKKINPMIWF